MAGHAGTIGVVTPYCSDDNNDDEDDDDDDDDDVNHSKISVFVSSLYFDFLTGRASSLEGYIHFFTCVGDSCCAFQWELGILHSTYRIAKFS